MSKNPRQMARVSLYLPLYLKTEFQSWCNDNNYTLSNAIVHLIEEFLEEVAEEHGKSLRSFD